jgi:magnesium transporter
VVQSLANKSGIGAFNSEKLLKVFLVALVNGIAISALVFLINLAIGEDIRLAMVVSIALLSVVVLASFMGTITPLVLDKAGVNPAIASGPFITTANDLLGLGIYFFVAHTLYHL